MYKPEPIIEQPKSFPELFVEKTIEDEAKKLEVPKDRLFTPEEIEYKNQIANMAYNTALKYNIDPLLFLSIIHRESSLGTKDPINVAQVKSALADYQKKVDPNLKEITTPEQSLEVGAWYLKEQLPSLLRYELLKNPARRSTPESKENLEKFEQWATRILNIQPSDPQELEKAFEEALKEQIAHPTNEELFAIVVGGYNEGAGNLAIAQGEEGSLWGSKAPESDPDTTWTYSKKVIDPIVEFAKENNYSNIAIDKLPETPPSFEPIQPRVSQEIPLADLGFQQLTPTAADTTREIPFETPAGLTQAPPEVRLEEPRPPVAPESLPPLAEIGPVAATPESLDTSLEYGGDVESVKDFWKTLGLATIYKEPKDSLLDPQVEAVASAIGNLGREIALVVTSYGIANAGTKALQGISWFSKAQKVTPIIVREGVRGATAGAVKTGISGLMGADLDWYTTAINMAQFGGGDLARSISQSLLKNATIVSPVIKELIGYSSDVVGGALTALAIHGEIDEFAREIIAPQAVAMGVVDLLFWNLTKGKVDMTQKAADEVVQVKMDLDTGKISPEEALQRLDTTLKDSNIDPKKLISDFEKQGSETLKQASEQPKPQETTAKPKDTTTKPKEPITEPSENIKKVVELVEKDVPYEDVGAPRVTPAKDKAPINTTRINSSDDVINSVYNMAKYIEDVEGKPTKSFEEIKKSVGDMTGESIAKELGFKLKDAKELQKILETAPEQLTQFRDIVVSLARQTQHQAQYIQELQKSGQVVPEIEKIKLQQLLTLQAEFTASTKDISTRIAQALAAHRIEVDGKIYDVSELRDWDLFKNPDALGLYEAYSAKGLSDAEFSKLVDRLANTTDIADLNKVAQQNTSFKNVLQFVESYRSSNLLMNPNTHMRNLMSQFVHQAHETATDFTEAFINILKGSPEDAMTFREATQRLTGSVEGMLNAWFRPLVSMKDIYGIIHNKQAPSTMDIVKLWMFNPKEFEKIHSMTQLEVSRAKAETLNARFSSQNLFGRFSQANTLMSGVSNVLDYFAAMQRNLSYGLLQAGDKPFAYSAYLGEVKGKIDLLIRKGTIDPSESKALYDATKTYRQRAMLKDSLEEAGARLGIPEVKLQDFVETKYREMDLIVPDKYAKLVEDLDKSGLAKANEMTWKTAPDTAIGKAGERFFNSVPGLRIIQPFIRTPTKIIEYALYTSGLTGKFWDDLRSQDIRRNSRAAGALAVSGSLYGLGALLYSQGNLTPTARNAEERKRMQEAGIQENSIKIGNTWVNINAIDPAPSFYLTTAANVYRELEEALNPDEYSKAEAKAFDFMTIIANSTLDKTWFQGMQDFLNALSGQGSERYFQSLARTFVPGYGYQSFYRQKFGDYLIDFNGDILKGAPRLDVYGKPIAAYDYKFGLRTQEQTTSPIRRETFNLGINLSTLNAVSYNMELTPEEHYEMIRYLDTHLKAEDRLNELVNTPAYQMASDAVKRQMIYNLWNRLVDQAKAYGASLAVQRGAREESIQKQIEELTEPPSEGSRYFKAPTPELQKQVEEILNWGQE